MKKFLLTVALVLAVVTSLTAGTLASYNQTLNVTGANVYSKMFKFDTAKSETFNGTLNLVPGDTVWYKVDVSQDMEVPVEYTINTGLTGELTGRLTKTVYLNGKDKKDEQSGDSFTVDKDAGTEGYTFYVKVEWDGSKDDAADVAAAGKTAGLTITVNGTSTEAAQTYEEGQTSANDKVKA